MKTMIWQAVLFSGVFAALVYCILELVRGQLRKSNNCRWFNTPVISLLTGLVAGLLLFSLP